MYHQQRHARQLLASSTRARFQALNDCRMLFYLRLMRVPDCQTALYPSPAPRLQAMQVEFAAASLERPALPAEA